MVKERETKFKTELEEIVTFAMMKDKRGIFDIDKIKKSLGLLETDSFHESDNNYESLINRLTDLLTKKKFYEARDLIRGTFKDNDDNTPEPNTPEPTYEPPKDSQTPKTTSSVIEPNYTPHNRIYISVTNEGIKINATSTAERNNLEEMQKLAQQVMINTSTHSTNQHSESTAKELISQPTNTPWANEYLNLLTRNSIPKGKQLTLFPVKEDTESKNNQSTETYEIKPVEFKPQTNTLLTYLKHLEMDENRTKKEETNTLEYFISNLNVSDSSAKLRTDNIVTKTENIKIESLPKNKFLDRLNDLLDSHEESEKEEIQKYLDKKAVNLPKEKQKHYETIFKNFNRIFSETEPVLSTETDYILIPDTKDVIFRQSKSTNHTEEKAVSVKTEPDTSIAKVYDFEYHGPKLLEERKILALSEEKKLLLPYFESDPSLYPVKYSKGASVRKTEMILDELTKQLNKDSYTQSTPIESGERVNRNDRAELLEQRLRNIFPEAKRLRRLAKKLTRISEGQEQFDIERIIDKLYRTQTKESEVKETVAGEDTDEVFDNFIKNEKRSRLRNIENSVNPGTTYNITEAERELNQIENELIARVGDNRFKQYLKDGKQTTLNGVIKSYDEAGVIVEKALSIASHSYESILTANRLLDLTQLVNTDIDKAIEAKRQITNLGLQIGLKRINEYLETENIENLEKTLGEVETVLNFKDVEEEKLRLRVKKYTVKDEELSEKDMIRIQFELSENDNAFKKEYGLLHQKSRNAKSVDDKIKYLEKAFNITLGKYTETFEDGNKETKFNPETLWLKSKTASKLASLYEENGSLEDAMKYSFYAASNMEHLLEEKPKNAPNMFKQLYELSDKMAEHLIEEQKFGEAINHYGISARSFMIYGQTSKTEEEEIKDKITEIKEKAVKVSEQWADSVKDKSSDYLFNNPEILENAFNVNLRKATDSEGNTDYSRIPQNIREAEAERQLYSIDWTQPMEEITTEILKAQELAPENIKLLGLKKQIESYNRH